MQCWLAPWHNTKYRAENAAAVGAAHVTCTDTKCIERNAAHAFKERANQAAGAVGKHDTAYAHQACHGEPA